MKNSLKLKANAKINIHLEVTGKRENGYHDISSIMQSVSLYDEIEIFLNDSGKITLKTNCAEISGENSAVLAAEKFFGEIGSKSGAAITLKKNIPLSAGLGGGSADGAAVLCALNSMYDFPVSEKRLAEIALTIGADVPFCLIGGTKKAEGLGEILTPVNTELNCYVLLIKHHKKQSTGEMYKKINPVKNNISSTEDVINALIKNNLYSLKGLCRNDFLNVSDDRLEQTEICNLLYKNGALLANLSGSGPTVFGLFENKPADEFLNELKSKYKEVYLCKTEKSGIMFDL